MRNEATILKRKLDVLLRASENLKDTKLVKDKHLIEIHKNEEKYFKQKAEFDELKGQQARSNTQIKEKDALVRDIQHKISRKKQEQTRAEARIKDRE
jgi:hypothetical protein